MTEQVLRQLDAAFADAPRPANEDLLHEQCFDDGDIAALYGIGHWRDVPDDIVEREYAALSFLSAAGFRHFIPAYMSWVLRHPKSPAAVVDSTLWALAPSRNPPELVAFALSKFMLLDEAQRAAIAAFLEALKDLEDVDEALEYWQSQLEQRG